VLDQYTSRKVFRILVYTQYYVVSPSWGHKSVASGPKYGSTGVLQNRWDVSNLLFLMAVNESTGVADVHSF